MWAEVRWGGIAVGRNGICKGPEAGLNWRTGKEPRGKAGEVTRTWPEGPCRTP